MHAPEGRCSAALDDGEAPRARVFERFVLELARQRVPRGLLVVAGTPHGEVTRVGTGWDRRVEAHGKPELPPDPFLGISAELRKDGVYITQVFPDTAAAKCKLQRNDRIAKVAGVEISDFDTLLKTIRSLEPGQTVKIAYVRGITKKEIDCTMGERQN